MKPIIIAHKEINMARMILEIKEPYGLISTRTLKFWTQKGIVAGRAALIAT